MARSLTTLDYTLIVVASWLAYKLAKNLRLRIRTTKLRGPKGQGFIFGVSRQLSEGESSVLYEDWAKEYGSVYQIPAPFGSRRTVLCDPKAIAHFYSKETYSYRKTPFMRNVVANFAGKGLFYAEAEDHKRQRKALTPAFSAAAIRSYTPVFFDSAYNVKVAWDTLFQSSTTEDIVLDVQYWFNRVSLDSLGIAAFSHDFESLHGKTTPVIDVFEAFGEASLSGKNALFALLAPFLPILQYIPNKRQKIIKNYRKTIIDISETLLRRTRTVIESGGVKHDASKSIIGTLVKAENAEEGQLRMSKEEVEAQMQVLIVAGYESTSISLTWALIELCKYPERQAELRKELTQLSADDPTYDQLTTGLPYLEAVMREILRLHPPDLQTSRMAYVDDVIPLSYPIKTAKGKVVDSISLAEGELVLVPINTMNCLESIWGKDAKEFVPERWIDEKGITEKVKEMPGYHHILSFVDGTRMCLGRNFAVIAFKAVLSVLIKNYEFSFRDGPDATELEMVTTVAPRPKLKGETGISMPLRIRRIDIN